MADGNRKLYRKSRECKPRIEPAAGMTQLTKNVICHLISRYQIRNLPLLFPRSYRITCSKDFSSSEELGELSFGKLKTKGVTETNCSIDFPACCMMLQARRHGNDEIHIKILASGETNLRFKLMI